MLGKPTHRTCNVQPVYSRKQETNLSLGQEHIGYNMRETASQHGDDVVSVCSDDLRHLQTNKSGWLKA